MVEIVTAGALWLWNEIGKEMFGDEIEEVIKAQWDKVRWNEAGQRYLEKLYEEHAVIRPLGSPAPFPLEDIFTDVYILEKPTAFKRFNIFELREDPGLLDKEQAECVHGLDLVQREESKRLFILGGPGAGKTTFLKYLTIQAIKGHIKKVPIFLSLKRWSDSKSRDDLMAYLEHEFEICDFPDARRFITHILERGKALVLFDGLDEVPHEDDRRTTAIAQLTDFARQFSNTQCCITCRIAAVEYAFTHFTYVELADFNAEQIRTLVERWFAQDPEKGTLFFEQFERDDNKGLREMARTPLLLSLLCLAFQQTLGFPQRRVEIYEDAIDALLRKWDAERNIRRDDLSNQDAVEIYRKLSPGRKRQMLARLAITTFTQGDYFIEQDHLADLIADYVRKLPPADEDADVDGVTILHAIESQHGILVTRAHKIHSFAHLSFQEYFAAKAIEADASPALFKHLFERYLTDNRWREVFLLTASLLDNADEFLTAMRTAIDTLIAGDATLEAMAAWADQQARVCSAPFALEALRGGYWYLPFTRASTNTNAFFSAINLVNTIDHNRALIHVLANALILVRALAHARADNLDRHCQRTSTGALALDRALSDVSSGVPHFVTASENSDVNIGVLDFVTALENVDTLHGLTVLLPQAMQIVNDAMQHFTTQPYYSIIREDSLVLLVAGLRDIGRRVHQNPDLALAQPFARHITVMAEWSRGSLFTGLDQVLASLNVPAADADTTAWEQFDQEIERIIADHIDRVIGWDLTEEQAEQVEAYLRTTHLLAECLDLAYTSQRKALRASLLLPPGQWQSAS